MTTLEIGWLTSSAADVPEQDDWLLPAEHAVLKGLRVPKRRAEWRHGRWVGKQALDAAWRALGGAKGTPPLWQILAGDDGAPQAFDASGKPAPFAISLSHSQGLASCALARTEPGLPVRVGTDVERIEPRSDALIEQFFAPSEQQHVRAAPLVRRALVATAFWSAKESALKALALGLRADTRTVHVDFAAPPGADRFEPFTAVVQEPASTLCGAFRCLGTAKAGWVLALVSDPAGRPMQLGRQP